MRVIPSSTVVALATTLLLVLPLVVATSRPARAQDATPSPATPAGPAAMTPRDLTADDLAELDGYIADLLAATGVPGASVAVVQNGNVVYQQGFGVRALGDDAPVTPDTLMMIGSITKSMTATMAATLADDGALSWDTPVVELLPGFALADPALSKTLTIRNAFCACTGLPQRDPEFIFNSFTLTPELLVASVSAFPLTAPLGQMFQYSNQMFAVGGYAAAAATGDRADLYLSYVTAMRERILDPLGMSRSTFALDRVFASGNYAQPHGLSLTGSYRPVSLADDERHAVSVAPAGALWSNAAEMARFVQMELAGGVAPDGTLVVSPANLEATWQAQVSMAAPGGEAPGLPPDLVAMSQAYALGWVTGDYRDQPLLWHSGGTFGFSSQLAFLPEADLGVVVLTNGINADLFKLGVQFRLFELAFGLPPELDPAITGVIAATADQAAALEQQLGPVDPAAVSAYLGRYGNEVLGEVVLAISGDMLTLDAGEFRAELRPMVDPGSGTTLYLSSDLPLAGVTTVTFDQSANGPVMTLTDPTTGAAYMFTRVEDESPATPTP